MQQGKRQPQYAPLIPIKDGEMMFWSQFPPILHHCKWKLDHPGKDNGIKGQTLKKKIEMNSFLLRVKNSMNLNQNHMKNSVHRSDYSHHKLFICIYTWDRLGKRWTYTSSKMNKVWRCYRSWRENEKQIHFKCFFFVICSDLHSSATGVL